MEILLKLKDKVSFNETSILNYGRRSWLLNQHSENIFTVDDVRRYTDGTTYVTLKEDFNPKFWFKGDRFHKPDATINITDNDLEDLLNG